MKKSALFLLLLVLVSALPAQQKFALVIGNANYTGLSKLANPVNDANDIAAALQELGFTVDPVLDGNLEQMESAVMRLKNRLSVSKNSYGFFFYAGHGVQSNGVNYLIPVGANIPSESSLRDRAVSIQWALGELNEAGNELNVVVLDACRDNPFAWARSNSRGLSVISSQPADSIIVYATSAGSTAADGTGRNGIFTTQLLKNIKTPGLEVNELFRLTGADVARASNRQQIPAVYNQFFGNAYLGSRPAQPSGSAQVSAKEHFEKGKIFYERDDWDTAILEFTEAIRVDPNYAEAYFRRGDTYDERGDYDRAIADYTQAIRLDPNYAKAYYYRGLTYNNKNDYDRAIADYTQAIKLDPDYAMAYNNRGYAYYCKNDYDRAIADYTQAIKLDPDYAKAYRYRGNAYKDGKNDYDRAIADYTQAIRLNPNDDIAYHSRGNAYHEKKDYDRAIADYTQAIRLDPDYAGTYYNRGNSYQYGKNDYDRAIADYNQAIRLDPDYAKAYNNRGDAYKAKGDTTRANTDYAKAKELGYE